MVDDLSNSFWSKLGLSPPTTHRVEPLLPSTAAKLLSKTVPSVFVATFSTLNDLRRKNEAVYQQLSEALGLVVVDEGHYEPAVEWGKSVKGLGKSTIILAATPYRWFETQFGLLKQEHFRDVVIGLLNNQPEVEYFGGRFRQRFDPDRLTARARVVVPPSSELAAKFNAMAERIEQLVRSSPLTRRMSAWRFTTTGRASRRRSAKR